MGPFHIPALPERTRASCVYTCQEVWEGSAENPHPSYAHDDLPKEIGSVLDIGANIGAFLVWARARWKPAEMYAYEPNPSAAAYAKMNCPSMELHIAAVTRESFPVLTLYEDWGCSSTHFLDDHGPGYHLAVDAVHPRDLPSVELLKIDCEGSEVDVLAHYPHLHQVKACLYEFHNERLMNLCSLYCRQAGLHMVHLFDTATVRKSKHHSGTAIWVR